MFAAPQVKPTQFGVVDRNTLFVAFEGRATEHTPLFKVSDGRLAGLRVSGVSAGGRLQGCGTLSAQLSAKPHMPSLDADCRVAEPAYQCNSFRLSRGWTCSTLTTTPARSERWRVSSLLAPGCALVAACSCRAALLSSDKGCGCAWHTAAS